METSASTLHQALIAEVKRRLFEESVPRLKQCLALLSTEQIWYRPNEQSNSVGNLVLHLCGNVRQWIIAGLSKAEDVRKRQEEFDEKGPVEEKTMLAELDRVMLEVNSVLDNLSPQDLTAVYQVQGFKESGIAILVHVVEHFSYHVGQITYVVKALNNVDTGYYGGLELNNPE